MASVFDLIAGTYVTIYSRAADPQGANFWATTLGFANINVAAGAQATLAMADKLGQNFYNASSAIFNTTYPQSDSNSLFITKVYNNLGGSDPDGGGLNYWTDRVATLSLTNSLQVARAMTATEIALTLENFIPDPGDIAANLRAQTFQNKIAVSKAVASTNNASFNPASQSLTDPAYLGETNVLVGITNTEASKSVALSQVAAANTANNPTLMVGQNPPLTLTAGIDSPTQGFTSGNGATATVAGAVFTANPVAGTLGLNNTLNTGDNLQATGAAAGNSTLDFTAVLATAGLLANPGYATGVTMNGINTLNISNQANLLGIGAIPSGFQGNITGLTNVVSKNSVAGVQLGNFGQGLNTALKTVTIDHFANNPAVTGLGVLPVFAADIAQSASSAANSLTVNLKGDLGATKGPIPGTPGGAAIISIANDGPLGTKAAPNLSYGTQTYDTGTNTATYLQLEAQSGGFLGGILLTPSVDGTTTFNFKGAGTLAVGQDFAGDHQKVTTIDASGTTGKVYITGAAETASKAAGSSIGSNALGNATSANPFGLFGSAAGFLDQGPAATGTLALTQFNIGSGQTFLDVSSATLAQMAALTTTPGALVDLNNEIVVNAKVATTTTADTFKNIKGFSVLGIGGSLVADGAGGTINMKNLPSEINTILYQTSSQAGAAGDVFINNVTRDLKVDTTANANGHNLTVGKVGPDAGLDDSLTVVVGNADLGTRGVLGLVTSFGEEKVNFIGKGASTGSIKSVAFGDITDTVILTPTLTRPVDVTISGDSDFVFGATAVGVTATGGIFSENTAHTINNLDNLTITVTNTAQTILEAQTVADAAGNFRMSTNAAIIDASASGGLIMRGGDTNHLVDFTTGATAPLATSRGVTITGSATAGNILIGSLGNDTIVGTKSAGIADTIGTNGGADKITLAAGNNAVDHIALFNGISLTGSDPGAALAHQAADQDISFAFFFGQFATAGYWGSGASAGPVLIDGLGDGFGTSADMSTVTNFQLGATGDVLDFAVNAWGTGAFVNGLTEVGGGAVLTGNAVFSNAVNLGGTVTNPGVANVLLMGQTFTSASDLANGLSTTGLNIGAHAAGNYDFLVAYQSSAGDVRIADVHVVSVAGFSNTNGATSVQVSDMVQLVGVLDGANIQTALNSANINFQ